MSKRIVPDSLPLRALELFQPEPGVLYSLDATARLAGITRRSILIYCRAGLLRPVIQPPYGVMEFTEEAIYTLRRIEYLRGGRTILLPGKEMDRCVRSSTGRSGNISIQWRNW
jgi:hypothetical protein